jgi:hypothetical protein
MINVAAIGTGWCGAIRVEACAKSPLVGDLHIAEMGENRLREVADLTRPFRGIRFHCLESAPGASWSRIALTWISAD